MKMKVRKIILGIRFKLALITISAVAFVSILIGFAVIKQHEQKLQESMLLLGTTTIKGAADPVQLYLHNLHLVQSAEGNNLAPARKIAMAAERKNYIDKMETYFSSVIKKEKMLDIAFLIEINRSSINTDWKKWDQSRYMYFNRLNGRLFTQGSGRKDPLLEPTIYSHYMKNVDVDTSLTFTDILDDEKFRFLFKNIKKDYVIVGMPILNNQSDYSLYKRYAEFINDQYIHGRIIKNTAQRNEFAGGKDKVYQYTTEKKYLSMIFMKKIIDNNEKLRYTILLDSSNKKKNLCAFIVRQLNIDNMPSEKKSNLIKDCASRMDQSLSFNSISASRLQNILEQIRKRHNLQYRAIDLKTDLHKNLYHFCIRNRYEITSDLPLQHIALISFQKDIAGILGVFLHRAYFHREIANNKNEIINLILSIMIRAVFVAIFFPTFLIRKISLLSDSALVIGKGNFETKIDIKGSDELGRLADILNIMTMNLKKAQELKIEKIRMENELITAQHIQAALLPEKLPKIKGIEFGAYYAAQTESGGDYYDFIDLGDNRVGIAIADVSGHGVGSGLVMAMTRTLLHIYCTKSRNTKKILENINDYLKENTASNYFVSMFYGILDIHSLKLTYTSAGHNQALIIRNKSLKELPAGGIALGATLTTRFSDLTEVNEVTLNRGDSFIQYTDGVDEAMDSGNNEFGLDRFFQSLTDNADKGIEDLINSVVADINKFIGNTPQHDDITIIGFRVI